MKKIFFCALSFVYAAEPTEASGASDRASAVTYTNSESFAHLRPIAPSHTSATALNPSLNARKSLVQNFKRFGFVPSLEPTSFHYTAEQLTHREFLAQLLGPQKENTYPRIVQKPSKYGKNQKNKMPRGSKQFKKRLR